MTHHIVGDSIIEGLNRATGDDIISDVSRKCDNGIQLGKDEPPCRGDSVVLNPSGVNIGSSHSAHHCEDDPPCRGDSVVVKPSGFNLGVALGMSDSHKEMKPDVRARDESSRIRKRKAVLKTNTRNERTSHSALMRRWSA